jgi:hypothetical protein
MNMASTLLPVEALFLCVALLSTFSHAGTPAPAHFFENQLVDHLDLNPNNNGPYTGKTWAQRFYLYADHFKGPGSPIFVVLGGEGGIEPSRGLFYPFITDTLASAFGAFVLEPEHRFYGTSQPVSADEIAQARKNGQEDPRVKLLTSEQALYDMARLIDSVRDDLGCSIDRFSAQYCPIITVGGSYPGFLSAMARILFPFLVDIAYAASAPMKFYSQQTDSSAYYNHISSVAEKAKVGCAQAVRQTLDEVVSIYHDDQQPSFDGTAIGACEGTVPDYIQDTDTFLDELIMLIGYTFANDNMAYYPPSKDTRLYKACEIFASNDDSSLDKVRNFLVKSLAGKDDDCFDMRLQLPTGPNATISGGDWSGVGTGQEGESWDFQTCTLLVETIAFGPNSMFPPREWTMDWLTDHCQSRFGVTPRPHELVNRWNFDDLENGKHSNILFTNGLNDGWSVSGIQTNLSNSLIALNFPNGAHHSDLFQKRGPSEEDTEDLQRGFRQIQTILATWLEELPSNARTTGN